MGRGLGNAGRALPRGMRFGSNSCLRRPGRPLWREAVRRVLLALLLILGFAPGTWSYQTGRPWNEEAALRFTPVALPPKAELAPHLGAFALEGIWEMTSPHGGAGGLSALLALPDGRLLAVTDYARRVVFSPPGAAPSTPVIDHVLTGRGRVLDYRDTEAATRDPATGTIWIAREDINAISRHDPDFAGYVAIRPRAMRHWARNSGAEAMVRLADGRFVVLAEGLDGVFENRLHRALLFPRDPLKGDRPLEFAFAGPPEFSTTDMAQLPDGRVLILMRRLVWPLPLRFAGRIVIADPAAIRRGHVWRSTEVAKLTSSLPVDNFEGIAVAPRDDGRVTVWLISDNNNAATQRTLLWKLAVDPARLP